MSVCELPSEHEINIYVNRKSKKYGYNFCCSHEITLYGGLREILTLGWKMLSGSSAACTAGRTASTVKSITDVSGASFAADFEEMKFLGTKLGSLISSRTLFWCIGVMGSVTNTLETTLKI